MLKALLFYLRQILLAFDQLLNTLIPGGMADETLSARAHRMREKGQSVWGWTADFIDLIFFWQKDEEGKRNHCQRSYQSEKERKHFPTYYRGQE